MLPNTFVGMTILNIWTYWWCFHEISESQLRHNNRKVYFKQAQSLLLNTYVKNVTPVHESSSAKENLKYGRSVSPIRVARS